MSGKNNPAEENILKKLIKKIKKKESGLSQAENKENQESIREIEDGRENWRKVKELCKVFWKIKVV